MTTVRARLMGLFLLSLIRILTGAQARWQGCPPKAEQRIYFANHQSHADLVLMWAALPAELRSITRPIAARDYWCKTNFKRWITSAVFNAIYIDRIPQNNGGQIPIKSTDSSKPEKKLESDPHLFEPLPVSLQPLVDALEQGDSIILFPEGTRGNQEEPQRFKAGLWHLARRFPGVVLVPAWINNVQRVMPKGEIVPVPILCSVTFGAPVVLASGEDKAAFLSRARLAVMALRET